MQNSIPKYNMRIVTSSSSQFFTLNFNLACFLLCQTDRSETSGNTREKWDIFRSNWVNQQEWLLPFVISFSNSQHKWRERRQWTGLSKWKGKFWSERVGRFKWTTSRGGPEYPGRKEPKRTFSFDLRPKFPESLARAIESTPHFHSGLSVSKAFWTSSVQLCTKSVTVTVLPHIIWFYIWYYFFLT